MSTAMNDLIVGGVILLVFGLMTLSLARMVKRGQATWWGIIGSIAFGLMVQWWMYQRRERAPPGYPQKEAAAKEIRSRPVLKDWRQP